MEEESRKKLFTRVHKVMEHSIIIGFVVYKIFCYGMVVFASLDYSRLQVTISVSILNTKDFETIVSASFFSPIGK